MAHIGECCFSVFTIDGVLFSKGEAFFVVVWLTQGWKVLQLWDPKTQKFEKNADFNRTAQNMCTFSGHFSQSNRPTKINENCLLIWFQLLVLKCAYVVLKSAFFLTSCVFGSCFRTLAVNLVWDLFFSLLFSFSGLFLFLVLWFGP